MAIELLRRRPPSELLPTQPAEELIEHFEGCVLYAYDDKDKKYPKTRITPENAHTVKGRLTIGFGRAVGVKPGDTCTMAQAREWLREDIEKHAQIVRNTVTVPLTQSEFNALTALVYNIGYIPPSMKACLNGGVTDKGKVMAPGSYGSAMLEFPRNCRAGGKPLKGLYRRRLAEACVFSDLPWENACSISVVKMGLTPDGEIDPDETTSLEDTILKARLDTSKAPDTSATLKAPWSELILTHKAEPAPSVAPAKAEQPEAAPARAPAVSAPKTPEPVAPVSPSVAAGPAPPAKLPPSPPVAPVPVLPAPKPKLPDPPVPIGQQTSAVDGARRSEEWSANTKAMWQSRRFYGLMLIFAGRIWMLKTGSSAFLGAVSDPLVMEFVGGFGVMIAGELIQMWGQRKATKALR